MADIDVLTTPTYRALDYEFRLQTVEPLHSVFVESFAPLAVEPGSGGLAVETIVVDRVGYQWRALGATEPVGRILARVLEYVNRQAACSLDGEVPLHGAAVCDEDGNAIALVGRSGAGKSTLGLAAVSGGRRFLAEEITAVEQQRLAVRSYHRPVGVRPAGAAALGIEYPAHDERFAHVFPLPVAPDRRAHAGTLRLIALVERGERLTEIVPVASARALAELVEHTVVPRDERVVAMFRSLEHVVRNVPVVRLRYDTVAQGLALLDQAERLWNR